LVHPKLTRKVDINLVEFQALSAVHCAAPAKSQRHLTGCRGFAAHAQSTASLVHGIRPLVLAKQYLSREQ
jgi:hypothetical protein